MSPAAVLSSHRLCAPRWGRGRLSGRADRRSAATLTGVVNLTSDTAAASCQPDILVPKAHNTLQAITSLVEKARDW